MKKLLFFLSILVTTTLAQAQFAYQIVQRTATTGIQSGNITGSGAAFHNLTWNATGTISTCSVRVDSSADNITWGTGDIVAAQTCTTNGVSLSTSHIPNYVRINVTTLTGGGTLVANLTGYITAPSGGGTITGVTAGTGLSGGGTSGSVTVNIANTAVIPASYTNTNLTVDQQGRITAASNGTAAATNIPALGKFLCGNHADGSGATWTCVSRVNVASGDHLVAGCSGLRTTSATTTIADTLTTTWTRIGSEYAETSPNTYNITAFRGTAASSGADTITCTSTDSGTSFTGSFLITVLGDSSVDVAPTGNQGTNGHSDSTQLTTTVANDLCFQWMTGAAISSPGAGGNTLVYNAANGVGLAMRTVGPTGNYMLTTETGGNFGNFSFCLK